jgi:hypothetical protein
MMTRVDVGTNVGVRSVGEGSFVAVSVGGPDVLVGNGEFVTVDSGGCSLAWVAVAGKSEECGENGVRGLTEVVTARKVTNTIGLSVAVSPPVTGRSIRPAGLGTIFTSISFARATAVLLRLSKESCVLRNCRSMAVGGFESMLATMNNIHAMPRQRNSKTKACKEAIDFFIQIEPIT